MMIQARLFGVFSHSLSRFIGRFTTTHIVLIVLATVVSVLGRPFEMHAANSGRYLLPVLRASDASLFVNDPVVVSLREFASAFYRLLELAVAGLNVQPQSLGGVVIGLYVLTQFGQCIAMWGLAQLVLTDHWLFGLLAAWMVNVVAVPVGGIALFAPMMTHAEIATVLGLTAIGLLLTKRYLASWIVLGVALLVHPLLTLHLALTVAPVGILSEWPITRPMLIKQSLGWAGFAGFLASYWVAVAPTPLSAMESHLFLAYKGNINHISPLSQSAIGWYRITLELLLAFFLSRTVLARFAPIRKLTNLMLAGALIGLVLSGLAISFDSVSLALLQPMRIFVWVKLFGSIIAATATVESLRHHRELGVLLLALWVLTIVDSLWVLAMLPATVVAVSLFHSTRPFVQRLRRSPSLKRLGMILLAGAPLSGWLLRNQLPFLSFHDPTPVVAVGLLAAAGTNIGLNTRRQQVLTGAVLALCVVSVSVAHFSRAASRRDVAWIELGQWISDNTDPSQVFLSPPDGDNFRVHSLRTSLTESVGALPWVDPILFTAIEGRARQYRLAWNGTAWSINDLQALAQMWGAAFIVVKGPFVADDAPVYRNGDYAVFGP